MTRRHPPEELELDAGPLFRSMAAPAPRVSRESVGSGPASPSFSATAAAEPIHGAATIQAEQRRDEGMSNALASADARDPDWADRFIEAVRERARHQPTLMAEDVLEDCPAPAFVTGRAVGPLMQRARRLGIIERGGYAPARTSNLSGKVLWKSLIFAGVQA